MARNEIESSNCTIWSTMLHPISLMSWDSIVVISSITTKVNRTEYTTGRLGITNQDPFNQPNYATQNYYNKARYL